MSTGKLLATQGYVVGIEISGNGTRQSVALADLNGHVLYRLRRSLDGVPDTQNVLSMLDTMLAEALHEDHLPEGRLLRVGIAVGGLVDSAHGVVRTLYHTHSWDNFPLQDYFAERLDAPCIIDNNANAAALAEVQHGIGEGERVVLYVGLGRGIGGALIVNGHIYHGMTCTAGEIGHFVMEEDGPVCSCGGRGHLEALASARAIIAEMLALSKEFPQSQAALNRITNGHVELLTAEQVFRLAAEGDAIAQRVVAKVHHYLGIALVNIVHFVNPSVIILGGSVTQAGDLLMDPLRNRVQQLCLPSAYEALRIVRGSLGSDANLLGAVTLALQDL